MIVFDYGVTLGTESDVGTSMVVNFGFVDDDSSCVATLSSFAFAFRDEEPVLTVLELISLLLSLHFVLFFFVLVHELSSLLPDPLLACTTFETPKKKKYEPTPAAMNRNDSE